MAERAHAKLSASGAARWIACPKSVALEELFEEQSSPFAEEGTIAHELGEKLLKREFNEITAAALKADLQKNKDKYTSEMHHYVKGYVEYCTDLYKQEQIASRDAIVSIEEKLNFSEWAPDGFGTGDFLIVSRDRIIVIDLKYGKGVPVSAEDNPQTRLYGLGAYNEYGWIYPVKEVQMHIYQPRLNNISVEVMSLEELLEWGETIKPRAEMADSNEGEYNPGPHCKFCRARATCRARSNHMLEVIRQIISKKED